MSGVFSRLTQEMSESVMFKNLASLLTPDERLEIFKEYCKILEKRIPERVWMETEHRIRKTDVYRYLPKSKSSRGGHTPNPDTTAKIFMALLKRKEYEL